MSRPTKHNWNEECPRIGEELAKGSSVRAIATCYGVDVSTIWRVMDKVGLTTPRGRLLKEAKNVLKNAGK